MGVPRILYHEEKATGAIHVDDIKRCYIEDLVVKVKCPNCGDELEHDYSNDYLSYPVVGEKSHINFYCEKCDISGNTDCYFEVPMKVVSANITIEFDKSKLASE